MNQFALKGNILFTPQKDEIKFFPDAYVICRLDTCQGVYITLPDEFRDIHIIDYGDSLIVPGMTDIHIHAPQYSFRGRAWTASFSTG